MELDGAKEKLGWPKEPRFYLPDESLAFFRQAAARGAVLEREWQQKMEAYCAAFPQEAAELERRLAGKLPEGWDQGLPEFPADEKGVATRSASGKVLNALSSKVPELFGGSADLAPSTNTWMTNSPAFATDCQEGRNIHFGVREHGMGSVVNGMSYHGGVIPFWRHLYGFFGLYAPARTAFGAFTPGLDLGFHPRQHRRGRRRPDPPAG